MGLTQSRAPTAFKDVARQHIYNMDAVMLKKLLEDRKEEFVQANITDDICVELIQRRWDSETIMCFAKKMSDHQLGVLIATAVLQRHVVPLGPLFALMSNPAATIASHHLAELFLVAIASSDAGAVEAMVTHKCFDNNDARAPRLAVRLQMEKSVPDEQLLRAVLENCLRNDEQVAAAREALTMGDPKARNAKSKEVVEQIVLKYLP